MRLIGLEQIGLIPTLYSPYKNVLPCPFDDFKYILQEAVSLLNMCSRQDVTQTSYYCSVTRKGDRPFRHKMLLSFVALFVFCVRQAASTASWTAEW
jgi:hypothetical protein